MTRECLAKGPYLRIPIENGAPLAGIGLYPPGGRGCRLSVRLAQNKIDFWGTCYLESVKEGEKVILETEKDTYYFRAVSLEGRGPFQNTERPLFHFTLPCGTLASVTGLELSGPEGRWKLFYRCNRFSTDAEDAERISCGEGEAAGIRDGLAQGADYFDLQHQERSKENGRKDRGPVLPPEPYTGNRIRGDLEAAWLFRMPAAPAGRHLLLALSRTFTSAGYIYNRMLTMPFYFEEEGANLYADPGLERLRIWKREWEMQTPGTCFREELSFRIAPGHWPNIRILQAEGGPEDIQAGGFEIRLKLRAQEKAPVRLEADGIQMRWEPGAGRLYAGEGGRYELAAGGQELELVIFSDYGCGEILCCGQVIFILKEELLTAQERRKPVDNGVSGNLEKCSVIERPAPALLIEAETGGIQVKAAAYGLRRGVYPERILDEISRCREQEEPFYRDAHYAVYNHHVRDDRYGAPDAWAVSAFRIYSPVRVTEEFMWRDTPWGDMVRVVNRGDVWRPDFRVFEYPQLSSGVTVLDAAYYLALDTFVQCKRSAYALEGQRGLWSAGLFQGAGEGFGVWIRDSAHTALRGGSLLDPDTAGRTLAYTAGQGFDNGSDGRLMAICGIWDHYLVTGNEAILYETWDKLVQNIEEIERGFVREKGLAAAEQSTSNDAFPEPENDGYCLSTECYTLLAYRAMGKMGQIIGETEERTGFWLKRSEEIRERIQALYWNPHCGYFTSGPKGSSAFREGGWETSGEECAIWSKFGIASRDRKQSVLDKLQETAMCEYGIRLFPGREKGNHFCGSVWTVWEAGFASAASECGRPELLRRLIAQQVRSCVMNKTFYEVIDADTGKAWRWPGQLWHAAGFLSLLLYGVFGIEYGEEGLCFHPCVPEKLAGIEIKGLKYRNAVLYIRSLGWGSGLKVYINGERRDKLGPAAAGRQEVEFRPG